MIAEFIETFMTKSKLLEERFIEKFPSSYYDVMYETIKLLNDPADYESPDPERIQKISDSGHHGNLFFIVGDCDYEPGKHWIIKLAYGSCSACDTLEKLKFTKELGNEDKAIKGVMTLALHIVQQIREV